MSLLDALMRVRIYDDGVEVTERGAINFIGATIVDDPVAHTTNVTVGGDPAALLGSPLTTASAAQPGARLELSANPCAQPITCATDGTDVFALSSNIVHLSTGAAGPSGVARISDAGAITAHNDYGVGAFSALLGACCAGGKLWLTGGDADIAATAYATLVECDPATLAFTRRIHTSGATSPYGDIVATSTHLYFCEVGTDKIHQVALSAPDTIAQTLTVGGGATIYTLAIDTNTAHYGDAKPRLWALDQANKKLLKIELDGTISVEASYTCTDTPRGLAILNSGTGYVLVATDQSELWTHDISGGGFAAVGGMGTTITDVFPVGELHGVAWEASSATTVWLRGYDAGGLDTVGKLDVTGPSMTSAALDTTTDDATATTFPAAKPCFLGSYM